MEINKVFFMNFKLKSKFFLKKKKYMICLMKEDENEGQDKGFLNIFFSIKLRFNFNINNKYKNR